MECQGDKCIHYRLESRRANCSKEVYFLSHECRLHLRSDGSGYVECLYDLSNCPDGGYQPKNQYE